MTTGIELADPSCADLEKKTKKELIAFIFSQNEFYQVIADGALKLQEDLKKAQFEGEEETSRLRKCESHLEQARVMIAAIIEKWDWYE